MTSGPQCHRCCVPCSGASPAANGLAPCFQPGMQGSIQLNLFWEACGSLRTTWYFSRSSCSRIGHHGFCPGLDRSRRKAPCVRSIPPLLRHGLQYNALGTIHSGHEQDPVQVCSYGIHGSSNGLRTRTIDPGPGFIRTWAKLMGSGSDAMRSARFLRMPGAFLVHPDIFLMPSLALLVVFGASERRQMPVGVGKLMHAVRPAW